MLRPTETEKSNWQWAPFPALCGSTTTLDSTPGYCSLSRTCSFPSFWLNAQPSWCSSFDKNHLFLRTQPNPAKQAGFLKSWRYLKTS